MMAAGLGPWWQQAGATLAQDSGTSGVSIRGASIKDGRMESGTLSVSSGGDGVPLSISITPNGSRNSRRRHGAEPPAHSRSSRSAAGPTDRSVVMEQSPMGQSIAITSATRRQSANSPPKKVVMEQSCTGQSLTATSTTPRQSASRPSPKVVMEQSCMGQSLATTSTALQPSASRQPRREVAVDEQGNTALARACARGDAETVGALLAAGARVDTRNSDGETAFIIACERGHYDIARSLLDKTTDVNLQDNLGKTALITACMNGHRSVVALLLVHGALTSPTARALGNWSALAVAAFQGYRQIVQTLLEHGAEIDQKADQNETPLMQACTQSGEARRDCQGELIKLLLDYGADPALVNSSGQNALIIAARDGQSDAVHALLQHCPYSLHRDDSGDTALVAACKKGHHQVVECILAAQRRCQPCDPETQHALKDDCYQAFGEAVALRDQLTVDIMLSSGLLPQQKSCEAVWEIVRKDAEFQ